MPAKPLNPEQKADADRLRTAWEAFRRSHPGATQEWLADQCGWKTQAAVNQYLLGKIPLNLPALLKFTQALALSPEAISPSLAKQLGAAVVPAPESAAVRPSPGVARLMKVLEGLGDDEIMAIAKAIEVLRTPKQTAADVVKFKVGTAAQTSVRAKR